MKTLKLKTNLRCEACVKTIAPLLDAEATVKRWTADVSTPDKVLTVEGDDVSVAKVGELLNRKGYQVVGEIPTNALAPASTMLDSDSPNTSYYPLVLIFFYLLGTVGIGEIAAGGINPERAMRHFMAGFFLVFSFFKMLDVPAFALSYRSYDILAQRWHGYGYLYPFLELGLGAAYLADFRPILTNAATLVVMGVSTVGVVQSLLTQRKIRCACLGAVFHLPMSYVTLTEDLLMIGMAAAMLVMLYSNH